MEIKIRKKEILEINGKDYEIDRNDFDQNELEGRKFYIKAALRSLDSQGTPHYREIEGVFEISQYSDNLMLTVYRDNAEEGKREIIGIRLGYDKVMELRELEGEWWRKPKEKKQEPSFLEGLNMPTKAEMEGACAARKSNADQTNTNKLYQSEPDSASIFEWFVEFIQKKKEMENLGKRYRNEGIELSGELIVCATKGIEKIAKALGMEARKRECADGIYKDVEFGGFVIASISPWEKEESL